MSTCSSCGATITWLVTNTGKSMPVDGTITAAPGRLPVFDHKVHVSHFSTCPDRDKHRRPRK